MSVCLLSCCWPGNYLNWLQCAKYCAALHTVRGSTAQLFANLYLLPNMAIAIRATPLAAMHWVWFLLTAALCKVVLVLVLTWQLVAAAVVALLLLPLWPGIKQPIGAATGCVSALMIC
jgi:hypothetical protein